MKTLKGPNPFVGRIFPDGSRWIPCDEPRVVGYTPNPADDWESWGKTTKATLFVGLKVGRATDDFHAGQRIPDRLVYGIVYDVRTEQVGEKYGGSFVRQKGHYIPPKARIAGPETRRREDSMQVILFPAKGEGWAAFRRNIKEVVGAILDDLGQKAVIVEWVRGGRILDAGQYKWRP
jgi:hypothetical protein